MASQTEFSERLAERTREELERRAFRVKVWLLLASLAVIVALVGAAIWENYLPSWRLHQLRYARILDAKATDDWGRKLADDFKVELRQVVLPELNAIDRCVSCHVGIDDPRMTDVAQPYTVHPGDYLKWHDPNKFGCTICHRGQGRATVFEEAKAVGYHWDYPLLPPDLTQSSCGVCHTAKEVAARGGERYALGKQLFEQKGCLSCHKLNGRGGSLGPALDAVGMKVRGLLPMAGIAGDYTLPQWLMEHFDDPQKVVAGSQMPPPGLSLDEKEALTVYMLSLQGRDLPGTYLSPAKHLEIYKIAHPEPMSGERLFARYCSHCHDTGQYGRYDKFFGKFVPAVRGPFYSQAATRSYLAQNILKGHAGSIMPGWGPGAGGLTTEEIDRIVGFLLAGPIPDATVLPASAVVRARDTAYRSRGAAAEGRRLFDLHCVGCHGPAGVGLLGPSLNTPVFQQAATDGFLFATIAYGRPDTAMPSFLAEQSGLTTAEVEDLITYLRTLTTPKQAAAKEAKR